MPRLPVLVHEYNQSFIAQPCAIFIPQSAFRSFQGPFILIVRALIGRRKERENMLSIIVLSIFVLVTLASPNTKIYSLHERRDELATRKWVKQQRLGPWATLPMRIGLAQSNLEKGHDLLMDV